MKNDLADVTLVVDRSGSMSSCREEAEGGINAFIREQAEQPGECLLTLVQFDTTYEFVHRGAPIKDVPQYHLVPRGFTALLDAVGRAINEAGERLAAMKEEDRPSVVAFVICTDGQENASHEFTLAQIKGMIERQQSEYNWKFTYLGANQDSFAAGGAMGISQNATADYSVNQTRAAYLAAGQSLTAMRSGQADSFAYSDQQRRSMK